MATTPGDVNINFAANTDNAVSSIKKLQQTMVEFGRTVNRAGEQINQLFQDKDGNNIKPFENGILRVIDRMTRFLTAINGVKNSLDLLFGQGSNVSRFFEATSEGLRVAVNLGQLAKDTLGQVAAGFAGVAAAAIFFVTALVEARIKAQEAANDQQLKAEKNITAYKDAMEAANKVGKVFNDTFGEQAVTALGRNRSAMEEAFSKLRDLAAEREKLAAKVRLEESASHIKEKPHIVLGNENFGLAFGNDIVEQDQREPSKILKAMRAQVESLDREIEAFRKRITDISNDAGFLKLAAQVGKFSTEVQKAQLQFNALSQLAPAGVKLAQALQPFAEFGQNLVEDKKIANAKELLKVATDIYSKTVEEQDANKQLAQYLQMKVDVGTATLDQKQQLRDINDRIIQQEEDIAAAMNRAVEAQKKLHEEEAPKAFTKRFTEPFADSISSALVQGIVEGQKAMEIFANISKNLLTAALNDVMKNFKDGMISVFKDIAGSGGELLGSALITVVGVVAGVLGKRASSTDSFNALKTQIESTEVTRGIVAGPRNVAIAAVGDNLKRALVGVEGRLDIVINKLTSIDGKVSGVPFAGSVTA